MSECKWPILIAFFIVIVGNIAVKMSWVSILLAVGCSLIVYSLTNSPMYAALSALVSLVAVGALTKAVGKEGFNTQTPPSQITKLVRNLSQKNPTNIEGYEDVKLEKNETPAPAPGKNESEKENKVDMAMPFKLGEIPSQVKNGPHIDAGSTLIQAIKGLNPDQINAMTKDTQQLIDTQKSLMGMLGTMKPMLNDGKQLMETFEQMFG